MPKAQAEGRKVVIRRLPPGMTADECRDILGEEWKPGNGKADWARYDDGDVSNDPSDLSRPARYYLHVISLGDISVLSEKVQQLKWEDAKHTSHDPALIGPPYVELAPFQKFPTGKKRIDPRQGTIDSEPEFMKFLESLTAPTLAKETDPEQVTDDVGKADIKVTTTPLVEYLKEKKAIKAKEAALAKSVKHARQESQPKGKEDTKKKGKEMKSDKAEKSTEKEKEKPTEKEKDKEKEKEKEKAKEPVKLLTKKAAAQEAAEAAKAAASQIAKKAGEDSAPKSRRANIAAAAKILQRDLGLSPGSAHRRARQDAAKADAISKPESNKDTKEIESNTSSPTPPTGPSKSSATPPSSAPTAPKAQTAEGSRRGRGGKGVKQNSPSESGKGKGAENLTTGKSAPIATTPVILKRTDDSTPIAAAPQVPTTATPSSGPITPAPTGPKAGASRAMPSVKPAAAPKKGHTGPSVTSGATRGFVKHANPSQGVTEPLLKQALEAYGPVAFVEIDKRKGFAYVDFGNHDALAKAIAASPVSVAQGTVQVLERKDAKKGSSATAPSATAPSAAAPSAAAPVAAAPQATTQPAQPNAEKKAEPQADRSKRGGRGRGRRGGANGGTPGGNSDQAGPSTSQAKASGDIAPPG